VFTAASFSVCNVERNQIVLKFTQVVVCGLGLVFSWLFGSCTDKKQFLRPVPWSFVLHEFPYWLYYSQVIVSNCRDLCAVAGDASASVCGWGQRQRRCLKTIGFHRRRYAFIFTQGGLLTPLVSSTKIHLNVYIAWCSVQQCHSIPTHWIDHTVALCPFVKQDEKQS
jgi:hypothetical protein